MTDRPFDTGLQLERTTLAWDRTALSLLAGVLIATRLAHEALGGSGYLVAAAGAGAAFAVRALARRRHALRHAALRQAGHPRIAVGGSAQIALLASATSVCSAVVGFALLAG